MVTLVSLAIAALMSLVTWRVVREDRRRSDARVDALAAAIRTGDETEAPAAENPAWKTTPVPFFMAAGVLVLGIVVAAVLTAGPRTAAQSPAPASAPVAAPPLELVALEQDVHGDRLTVRGVVRNPSGAAGLEALTAVVLVFDHDGGFASSGRAIIATRTLAPGAESPFTVEVTGLNDIGRYRVSFRTDERVVEHIDKRER